MYVNMVGNMGRCSMPKMALFNNNSNFSLSQMLSCVVLFLGGQASDFSCCASIHQLYVRISSQHRSYIPACYCCYFRASIQATTPNYKLELCCTTRRIWCMQITRKRVSNITAIVCHIQTNSGKKQKYTSGTVYTARSLSQLHDNWLCSVDMLEITDDTEKERDVKMVIQYVSLPSPRRESEVIERAATAAHHLAGNCE